MLPPILIVEDDATISTIMSGYLESEGLAVEVISTGRELLRRLSSQAYSVVLLDLGLPDEDGLVLLRKKVARSDVPVMVVTGRTSLETRLTAFELGASDVLTKPFDPRELRYRVLNLIRRGKQLHRDEFYHFGSWCLDLSKRTVESKINARRCSLTRAEFDLLVFLLRGKGRVFSRAQILDAITSPGGPESDRAVDVLISRLRTKLSLDSSHADRLVTVRGIGYRLEMREPSTD